MKLTRRISALLLAMVMMTALLTGCGKKEAPAAADQVAVALFDMILKNDASSTVELFGYPSEEDARKDMGLEGDLYDEMAEQVIDQFASFGVSASSEDVQNFINAFISMFKDVTMTAVVKESDEKAGTAVVTCTISTFEPNALTDATNAAMLEAAQDPNFSMDNQDAAFSIILNAMSKAISGLTPTGETADFDVDFVLETLSINGKDREAWLPKDAEAFGMAISTTAMGG